MSPVRAAPRIATTRIAPDGSVGAPGARAKGIILGKDEPRKRPGAIAVLPDRRVAVAWSGPFIGSPCGLQIRAGDALTMTGEITGARPPIAVHPSGARLLAGGPLFGGYQSTTHLIETRPLAIARTLPVRKPFAWLPHGGGFLALSPHSYDGIDVDPADVEREPWLKPFVTPLVSLLRVEADANRATPVRRFDEHIEPSVLAPSPDGSAVYWADHYCNVGAEEVAEARTRWQTRIGAPGVEDGFGAYALAVSPEGRHVAVAGFSYDRRKRDFAILDSRSGAVSLALSLRQRIPHGGARVEALAWLDEERVLAATAGGALAIVSLDGAIETWRGAQAVVNDIVIDAAGARILVCASEKHLRAWPL